VKAQSKPETLSLRALGRATLARQLLLAREKTTPVRAIERLAGMQAQWPKPPYIGLWTRLQKFDASALNEQLAGRAVVRATMMRGTIHLVSAKDYLVFRPIVQPLLTRGMRSVLREHVDAIDHARMLAVARAAFDERPRTFTEMRAVLTKLHPKINERALGYATRMQLPLVMVPTDAMWGFPGNADFAAAETWLGAKIGDDEKPHALVLRYLAAFGPASVADAQTWSGLQALRDVFESLRPKLVTFRDERGRELFDLPKAPRPSEDVAAPARFLPEFDNLILGHADRTRFIANEHKRQVFLSALRVTSTFLVDGVVAGTWKTKRVKRTATLVVEPFAALSKKTQVELGGEADALVRFAEPDADTFDVVFAKPSKN
jgi:hypothetical protein